MYISLDIFFRIILRIRDAPIPNNSEQFQELELAEVGIVASLHRIK
jgi:hypothetical protein